MAQGFIAQLEREARRRANELENLGLLPDGFLEHHYPLTREERLELRRLSIAWQLARDVAALSDLLAGIPVDPARVDQAALQHARTASLVQLVRPIDVLQGAAA